MQQYLDLIHHCLDNGVAKTDRTGVGTLALSAGGARRLIAEQRFESTSSSEASYYRRIQRD